MDKFIKRGLEAQCTEHWWNMGTKTLSFKGTLEELLKRHKIKYFIKKTDRDGIYMYYFKSAYRITFTTQGTVNDFRTYAKQFIQMELVRMGDKSTLFVDSWYRPIVTVNH